MRSRDEQENRYNEDLLDKTFDLGNHNFYHSIYNHKLVEILKVWFQGKSANELKTFLAIDGARLRVTFEELTGTSYTGARAAAYTSNEFYEMLKIQGKKCHQSKITELLLALKACTTQEKVVFANFLLGNVLRMSVSNPDRPDIAHSEVAIRLISLFLSQADEALLRKASDSVTFKALLKNRTAEYYKTLIAFLEKNGQFIQDLEELLNAQPQLMEFLDTNDLDVSFLTFMQDNKISFVEPVAEVSSRALTVPTIQRSMFGAKLPVSPKLDVVRAVFDVFPNDKLHQQAIVFVLQNKMMLFKLNGPALALFKEHVSGSVINDDKFLKVLSKAETQAQIDFLHHLFTYLDQPDAFALVNELADKGLKQLTPKQVLHIAGVLQNKEIASKEKCQFCTAMIRNDYTEVVLEGIARLYGVIVDREKLTANLKDFKAGDNLLTLPYIELLEELHRKDITITFEYAKHLASKLYLREFTDVIHLMESQDLRKIFDKNSVNSKVSDWLTGLMLMVQTTRNPVLANKVTNLVLHLWTLAKTQSNDIGLSLSELLTDAFVEHFLKFFQVSLGLLNFAANPEYRYAAIADYKKIASVITLMHSHANTMLSLENGSAQTTLALENKGFFSTLFGGTSQSSPQALLVAAERRSVLTNSIQRALNINGLDAEMRPRFSGQDDLKGFVNFMRNANANIAMLEGPQEGYLALMDATGGPTIESLDDDVTNDELALVEAKSKGLELTW